MKHYMHLNPEPFEKIASGRKTIELRLYDEKRQQIKVGDILVFTNLDNKEALQTKVVNLHRFAFFQELYSELDLVKCGYMKETAHLATPEHMEKYYSKEKQQKYGVLGIEICVM